MSIEVETHAAHRPWAGSILLEGMRRLYRRIIKRNRDLQMRDTLLTMTESQLEDIGLAREEKDGDTRLTVSDALNSFERRQEARRLIESMGWRSIR